VILLICSLVQAQSLTLDRLMEGVDTRLPYLGASSAKVDQAAAKVTSAGVVNDPYILGSWASEDGVPGVEDGSLSFVQPTSLGPTMALNWDGSVANGTPSAELSVPILDGLIWGDSRLELVSARLRFGIQQATLDLDILLSRGKAAETWWKWVAYGRKLDLAERQLALAVQRNSALERGLEVGQRSRLDLIDNQRALLSRKSSSIQAKQELDNAAVSLSLWWRDAQGRPQTPARDQLPQAWGWGEPRLDLAWDMTQLEQRPDVIVLDLVLELADAELRRAQNQALPKVDVKAKVEPDKVSGGLALEVPILMRKERGSLSYARAELERVAFLRQGALDQLAADLQQAHLVVQASWDRVVIARQALAVAQEALSMERTAFELGGSEVFRLVLREGQLADAEKSVIEAELSYGLADLRRRMVIGLGPL
jgi:outer membrane protein TolC